MKLTEQYRSEIQNILSNISSGLGESVINVINPKIEDLSTNFENNKASIEVVNNEVNEHANALRDIISEVQTIKKHCEDLNTAHLENSKNLTQLVADESLKLSQLIHENNIESVLHELKRFESKLENGFSTSLESLNMRLKNLAESIELNEVKVEAVHNELKLRQARAEKIIYFLLILNVVSIIAAMGLYFR